ncbi:hypothetical protein ACOME3_001564 [Neoechinorhynchus agilis]
MTSGRIFVSDRMTCVIAGDYMLATKSDANQKEGTGDHITDPSTNKLNSEANDIYRMSLVLWEIWMRSSFLCSFSPVPEAKLPYSEFMSENSVPTFETMKKIVYDGRQRPSFPTCWDCDDFLVYSIVTTLKSGWVHEWRMRPSCSCLHGRLKTVTDCILDKYKSLTGNYENYDDE